MSLPVHVTTAPVETLSCPFLLLSGIGRRTLAEVGVGWCGSHVSPRTIVGKARRCPHIQPRDALKTQLYHAGKNAEWFGKMLQTIRQRRYLAKLVATITPLLLASELAWGDNHSEGDGEPRRHSRSPIARYPLSRMSDEEQQVKRRGALLF